MAVVQPTRRSRVSPIGAACLAFLLLSGGIAALAGEDAKPADALWQMYFNAAAVEIEASQSAASEQATKERAQNAIVLLQSALDAAARADPGGPRPRITAWLLSSAYDQLGEGDAARSVLQSSKPVDPKSFGADLLPIAKTLDRLGNVYVDRPRDKSKDYLGDYLAAFRCFEWETAILANSYPKDDPQLAMPQALYGLAQMRLGFYYFDKSKGRPKSEEEQRNSDREAAETYLLGAIDAYRKALDIWEENSRLEFALAANSQRYMVSEGKQRTWVNGEQWSTAGAAGIQRPSDVNILLANTGEELGDLYLAMQQKDKAREQFVDAEKPLNAVLTNLQDKWPRHLQVAYYQNRLALLYLRVDRFSDADRLFRDALETMEESKGKTAAETKTLAANLVYSLKMQHRNAEAESIAQQYSVSSN